MRRRWGLRSRPLSGLFALALRATAEQLKSAIHLVDDDLGGVAFHSVFFPLAGAESAFDVALAPFSQILTRDFGDLAEEHYAVPLGTLLLLAGLLILSLIHI